MEGHDKTRVARLKHRQKRASRAPAVLRAWEENGISAVCLPNDRQDEVLSWLRAHWDPPDQAVADIGDHLAMVMGIEDSMIVMDFWNWDEAVAVLAPARGLLRIKDQLRRIYPDGCLVSDQRLQSALLVDFDEHADGAQVSVIGSERKA